MYVRKQLCLLGLFGRKGLVQHNQFGIILHYLAVFERNYLSWWLLAVQLGKLVYM